MNVEVQESGRRLVVHLDGEDALDAMLDRARADALVFRLETRLDEGAAVTLDVSADGRRLELPARVKQVFRSGTDRFGTLLSLDAAAPPASPAVPVLQAGSATAEDAPDPPSGGAQAALAEPAADPEEPALTGETLGSSVAFELQRMRPDEKVRLALKANRAQRQLLLRDRTPQVLLSLLANPWLENAEVLEIAKNPKVVGPVLQRLADDRRFGPNPQVQSALARNPSTPSTVVARLLPLLPTRELRELARSQHVREAVRKAALRLYLGKM
jgi:hypothetical protein